MCGTSPSATLQYEVCPTLQHWHFQPITTAWLLLYHTPASQPEEHLRTVIYQMAASTCLQKQSFKPGTQFSHRVLLRTTRSWAQFWMLQSTQQDEKQQQGFPQECQEEAWLWLSCHLFYFRQRPDLSEIATSLEGNKFTAFWGSFQRPLKLLYSTPCVCVAMTTIGSFFLKGKQGGKRESVIFLDKVCEACLIDVTDFPCSKVSSFQWVTGWESEGEGRGGGWLSLCVLLLQYGTY